MAKIDLIPGVMSDLPWVTPFGSMKAGRGLNIRWRLGQLETLGLFGPLRLITGEPLEIPIASGQPVRSLFTTQGPGGIQIIAGSLNRVDLIRVDPASIPGGETRYLTTQIGTTLTPAATDNLPNPSLKQVVIPPAWWFVEADAFIIGQRAGVNESVRAWNRDATGAFNPIPAYEPADTPGNPSGEAPKGAVAGGVLNNILILLGCESVTGQPADAGLTVRWSGRNNFEMWDPLPAIDPLTGQANISGEFRLDRGSRIVGGGSTGFGVVVWTDKAMAMVNETGDLSTVLGRVYIDGARGLLSNRAWCEADGRIWWIDGSRTLNTYDGGRPIPVDNPMRRGTIDKVNERGAARIYLAPNPEYGEIIIWYPADDSTECNRAMVYNYREDSWSIWGLNRAHWYPRQGVQEAVAVGLDGRVFAHDIGPGCPTAYRPDAILEVGPGTGCGDGLLVGAENVEPISGFVEFGPMVTPEAGFQTLDMKRLLMSWLPTPAIGAHTDTLDVTLLGFQDASVRDARYEETQEWGQGDTTRDYRVGGRSMSIRIEFTDIKTVYRLGYVDLTPGGSLGGER